MHIPIVVVGGGIMGLSLIYELLKRFSPEEMVLFEKGPFWGEHATSRNSGVLHAGIYYRTGSLKHTFCLEGNRLWDKWSTDLSTNINRCGKILFASFESEVDKLEKYFAQAQSNGVPGVDWIEREVLDKLSEFVTIKRAFLSKSTGVIDVAEVIGNLSRYLYNKNVNLMLNNAVVDICQNSNKFLVTTQHEKFSCDVLVNAAGGFAIDLRSKLGLSDLQNFWVKGSYLKYNRPFFAEKLLYPVPQDNLHGLGLHTSFAADNSIRFGPDTKEIVEYEYKTEDKIVDKFYSSLEKIYRNVEKAALMPDFCGIRPKIKYKGKLYDDFWLKGPLDHGVSGYFEMCGIESPGFTAAPAIAQYMTSLIYQECSLN